jgi:WhiB family redox-sensing transcriptional regulator
VGLLAAPATHAGPPPDPRRTEPPEAFTPFPCQVVSSADLWFAERTEDVERAKAMCGPCPIRRACLAGALERREPWGVWGGEVFVDGVVVARKRGRGRPRKAELGAA